MLSSQQRAPVFEALKNYMNEGTVPFHVPGHKQGRGISEFKEFVGENVLGIDLTCLPDLDNILNPKGVIAEAQKLTAEAYGADFAYFLVNGTTSGIQAMIMAICQPGEKIIVPRNAHKSAIGGLILSGAYPIYIHPELNREFGVSMGITPENLENALQRYPDAKGVFLINPNYYGTVSNLKALVDIAHAYGKPVIVDEAHGAHLSFHEGLPLSAMQAGADLAASSAHKMAGSLTQSSFLLMKEGLINPQRVKSILNVTQTTSPSYILLASLDVARKQMATRGREMLDYTLVLTGALREKINQIPGLKLMNNDIIGQPGCYGLDPTKITINVHALGLSGFEVEKILRREYKVQVELSDLYNILLLVSIGDNEQTLGHLTNCLEDIVAKHSLKNVLKYSPPLPEIPEQAISPRAAFYGESKRVALGEAQGEISSESIMAYPPGIPLICAGERFSQEVIDYIRLLKEEQAELQGPEDPEINFVNVLKEQVICIEEKQVEEVG